MSHRLSIRATVGSDHRVTITLPDDVPAGDVWLEVLASSVPIKTGTLQDLLDMNMTGIWSEYPPEVGSEEIARELRERAWKRARD